MVEKLSKAALAILLLAAVSIAAAMAVVFVRSEDAPRGVVASGLEFPRGLSEIDGDLLVAEVMGGRLLRLEADGEIDVLAEGLPATLGGPTGQYPTGASAAVVAGDAFYYIVGEYRGTPASTLYALGVGADSTPVRVAGGLGRDGFPATAISNPYDLVAHPEDGFLISDGGRNALLWARESGDVEELVRFERRPHPDEQMRHRIDVVPSGITFGPDGALYMASFTGNPYQRGFAVVYRITGIEGGGRPRAEVHAEGFSFATDVAFAPDGSMLVTEFTSDMARLVAEYGMDGAEELPGRLVRWHEGTMDVLVEGLVTPTGLAVVGDNAYVSEEYAGRIRKIPLDGLGR